MRQTSLIPKRGPGSRPAAPKSGQATQTWQSNRSEDCESGLPLNGQKRRHYALQTVREYFAETSEAYFGTNDCYPFVRAELKPHDPRMYELLGKLWGKQRSN